MNSCTPTNKTITLLLCGYLALVVSGCFGHDDPDGDPPDGDERPVVEGEWIAYPEFGVIENRWDFTLDSEGNPSVYFTWNDPADLANPAAGINRWTGSEWGWGRVSANSGSEPVILLDSDDRPHLGSSRGIFALGKPDDEPEWLNLAYPNLDSRTSNLTILHDPTDDSVLVLYRDKSRDAEWRDYELRRYVGIEWQDVELPDGMESEATAIMDPVDHVPIFVSLNGLGAGNVRVQRHDRDLGFATDFGCTKARIAAAPDRPLVVVHQRQRDETLSASRHLGGEDWEDLGYVTDKIVDDFAIALQSDGAPVVGYSFVEDRPIDGEVAPVVVAAVSRLNDAGEWEVIGEFENGRSGGNPGGSVALAVSPTDDLPIFVHGDNETNVGRWNGAGDWEDLGQPFPGDAARSIAIDPTDGLPVLASAHHHTGWHLGIKKWYPDEGWQELFTGVYGDQGLSVYNFEVSLSLDTRGRPAVAFVDRSQLLERGQVLRYDNQAAWTSYLAIDQHDRTRVPQNGIDWMALDSDDRLTFLLAEGLDNNLRNGIVNRLEPDGSFTDMGMPYTSNSESGMMVLGEHGTPYVSYVGDNETGAFVTRWDDGTDWEEVFNRISITDLASDSQGRILVMHTRYWNDDDPPPYEVSRYEDGEWTHIGDGIAAGVRPCWVDMATGPDDRPVVAYSYYGLNGILHLTASRWREDRTWEELPSITAHETSIFPRLRIGPDNVPVVAHYYQGQVFLHRFEEAAD